MKLIKPSFEIIDQNDLSFMSTTEQIQNDYKLGIYKQIEKAGRTCYKSENRISKGSAELFVNNMINAGHGAMLEHGTVYLKFNRYVDPQYTTHEDFEEKSRLRNKYVLNKYSKCVEVCTIDDEMDTVYITTNLRVLVENNWMDDLKYLCEPTEHHERRVTVKFICDRGILAEFTRHRVFSFAAESTRYCNYSKDKFNNELTFIIPNWTNLPEGTYECFEDDTDIESFRAYCMQDENQYFFSGSENKDLCNYLKTLDTIETQYLSLIEDGWKPQEARSILPMSLKTELVMTGFVSDWEHFFKLRCDKAAHPQARELAIPLQEEFKKLNYIK